MLEIEGRVLDGGVFILGDQHPFTGSETIRFHHVGRSRGGERVAQFFLARHSPGFTCGDLGGRHYFFGKRL